MSTFHPDRQQFIIAMWLSHQAIRAKWVTIYLAAYLVSIYFICTFFFFYLDPGPRIICRFLLSLDSEKKKEGGGGSTLDKRLQVCMTQYMYSFYILRTGLKVDCVDNLSVFSIVVFVFCPMQLDHLSALFRLVHTAYMYNLWIIFVEY